MKIKGTNYSSYEIRKRLLKESQKAQKDKKLKAGMGAKIQMKKTV